MPTQGTPYGKAVEANAYRLRNSMTIVGTSTENSLVTDAKSVQDFALRSKAFASQVQQPLTDAEMAGLANGGPEPTAGRSHSPTYKPYSAGTFAYQAEGQYVIRSHSTKISGVTNSVIAIPGRVGKWNSINYLNRLRGTVLRARTWTVNGLGLVKYTHTYTNTADMAYSIDDNANSAVADQEAPTAMKRTLPGQLVLLETGATPTQKNYPAVTGV